MVKLESLKIKIFADGADKDTIIRLSKDPLIKGFTTNPTLMRKSGISDYEQFSKSLIAAVPNHPISFEVFADDLDAMEVQARVIASWGDNVFVKIPVTNTKGEMTTPIISKLSNDNIALNVTAVFTEEQVVKITQALAKDSNSIISVFAGRIADSGIDPVPHMKKCRDIMAIRPKAELLWASPRELLNIFHAEESGCHIITVVNDVLKKLNLIGKDLDEYSLDTVKMFYQDALSARFNISTEELTTV